MLRPIEVDRQQVDDIERIEHVRSKLLAMEPRRFEFLVKESLLQCGFRDVLRDKIQRR